MEIERQKVIFGPRGSPTVPRMDSDEGRSAGGIRGVGWCAPSKMAKSTLGIQSIINQVRGVIPTTCDLNNDSRVDKRDGQLVVNAALGLGVNP